MLPAACQTAGRYQTVGATRAIGHESAIKVEAGSIAASVVNPFAA
jgi:hypothetical protein